MPLTRHIHDKVRETEDLLAPLGLLVQGGFHPVSSDEVPGARPDGTSKTVLLVANAGPNFWHIFQDSPEYGEFFLGSAANPLDRWTEKVVNPISEKISARAVFPFTGPPYLPFQSWGRRTGKSWASPLGISIVAKYGLWHAFRAALLFTDRLPLPPTPDVVNPCLSCLDRPCLKVCPVEAFSESGYDVSRCTVHLRSTEGFECVTKGCKARRACPVGQKYQYSPEQAEFHMRALIESTQASD